MYLATQMHQGVMECLNKTGHEIVLSVESIGSVGECEWVLEVCAACVHVSMWPCGHVSELNCGCFGDQGRGYANLWRTDGDIQNTFSSVMGNIMRQVPLANSNCSGIGHWNDPDMLQVGNAGLSVDEQLSHFTL